MNIVRLLKIVICSGMLHFSSIYAATDANGTTSLPAVAGRFESITITLDKSMAPAKHAWYFWRNDNMLQTQDSDGDFGEIWQKTVTNDIEYRKLYHADKTAVEYAPADNPTNHIDFDWQTLAQMLSPKELAALTSVKKIKVLGKDAELRKGTINGQTLTVKWLINDHLPASIIRKDAKKMVTIKLLAIEPLASAHKQPFSLDALKDYRHIEAIDFGDMESDPFVKKIMTVEGHSHTH